MMGIFFGLFETLTDCVLVLQQIN